MATMTLLLLFMDTPISSTYLSVVNKKEGGRGRKRRREGRKICAWGGRNAGRICAVVNASQSNEIRPRHVDKQVHVVIGFYKECIDSCLHISHICKISVNEKRIDRSCSLASILHVFFFCLLLLLSLSQGYVALAKLKFETIFETSE